MKMFDIQSDEMNEGIYYSDKSRNAAGWLQFMKFSDENGCFCSFNKISLVSVKYLSNNE